MESTYGTRQTFSRAFFCMPSSLEWLRHLAGLMLIAIIVMKGWRTSAKTIAIFAGVFLILGGIYFVWRWNYFGYPLPNPFYKKGGGLLHWDGLQASFTNLFSLCGIFLLAYLIGFRSSKIMRQTIAFLIPVIGFASAFILISDETNFGGRFQYALLPIVLLSWFPLVRGFDQEIGAPALGQIETRPPLVSHRGFIGDRNFDFVFFVRSRCFHWLLPRWTL